MSRPRSTGALGGTSVPRSALVTDGRHPPLGAPRRRALRPRRRRCQPPRRVRWRLRIGRRLGLRHGEVRHQRGRGRRRGARPARGDRQGLREGVGRHGRAERGRPQHLPGEHQHLPPGLPGRRLHLVRRLPDGAVRRERPDHRRERRVADRRPQRLLQAGLHGGRRQAVLRADQLLPVGGLLPEVGLREERLGGADHQRRLHGADGRHAGQGHHPVRLRRQGRVACHGHLRHPQHAPQRLRLPHEPDGRRRGVGRRRGQARLRHLAQAAALPPGGPARSHLAGGGDVDGQGRVRHVPPRHVRRGRPRRERRGPRLLHLPRARLLHRLRRPRRPDRRLLPRGRGQEPGGRQGDGRSGSAARRRPTPATTPPTRRSSPPTRARAPRPTATCRRSPPRSSAPPPTSRSSWTATPTPTSPARS